MHKVVHNNSKILSTAVAGGLFGLYMGGSSLNIFSQIGLIILIGLAVVFGAGIIHNILRRRLQARAADSAADDETSSDD